MSRHAKDATSATTEQKEQKQSANRYSADPRLAGILQAYLEEDFFSYADEALSSFADQLDDVDTRAAHTDGAGEPQLIRYNKFGEEVSEVWVNEGYQKTVADMYDTGIVGYVHKPIPALGRPGNYHYSYAQGYLLSQVEPGFYCPVTLTMASAYLLDAYGDEDLKAKYLPHFTATGDTELYEGATFLTERQGGSDVGANVVEAVKASDGYRLHGEKYFASNAGMCGAAMVLARREGAPAGSKGLSLFLVPWENEDGRVNGLRIRRLKNKLGVKAVPSGEVEFTGARAYLVGEAEQGFYYMMEALNLSRVCNMVASLGIMKRAYDEALSYTHHREAFGQKLSDFPMVREQLMHMLARQEVQLSASFQAIERFDRVMRTGDYTNEDEVLNRLSIALLKMHTAEEAIHFSHEAIELHGGNGYIEDFVTPRLLRDAQVLTVWEGTANILGLELLRLLNRYEADTLFASEVEDMLSLAPEEMQNEKAFVWEKLVEVRTFADEVKTADEAAQTFHAKKLAKQMTNVLLAAAALSDTTHGDRRAQIIARIFLEATYPESGFVREPASLQHFADLV
ncbi:alkylation response protein AidB-like acyl-CoA dehydrogenase [Salsuginibacillus halophilus]|uniref:Alkylation response protein AidB-like acyl-CoA dehydrogenase n=1 Tax=Salsuginibacillus halophilus TaxID=517424 RepID=A0A2P8HVZ7_9BACI|nr:acyl-CoA dehydrogenase family protein [Salsuginibacillus halophilus]PSL50413.1 alkylation response protein AidB-like acyl-CoA dehydrogenase [Salsuginibacillus halophilus]